MQRLMTALARFMAALGGFVLVFLILLTVASVIGRALNGLMHWSWVQAVMSGPANALLDAGVGPILGDFELVEAGIALSIFAFMPITQLTAAHATVDIFTSFLPPAPNRFLIAFWEVVFAIALVIIAWRLYVGMGDKMRYGETTFLLQFPVWWAYAASFVAATVAAIVGIYTAVLRILEVVTGRAYIISEGEAGH